MFLAFTSLEGRKTCLHLLHTPALRAYLPNTFVVSGEAGSLVRFQSGLAGRGLANKVRMLSEERIEVSALLPSEIYCTLALVHEHGLHQCECSASTRVVSTVLRFGTDYR